MDGFDLDARPHAADIVNMYRLTLGRDPEFDSVVQERLRQPNREWLAGFLASSEFLEKIYDKVIAGGEITGGLFDQKPSLELRSWAAAFFPLTSESATEVAGAQNWYQLMFALFSNQRFADCLLPNRDQQLHSALLERLQERDLLVKSSAVIGAVESVVPGEITGWVLDNQSPDRRLAVELYINDILVMAAPTTEYRADLRQRFGGAGRYGFRLRFDVKPSVGRSLRATLRETGSRKTLAAFDLPPIESAIDEALAVKQLILQLRESLNRIEARLPALNYSFTLPLDAYDDYFARAYGSNVTLPLRTSGGASCSVLVNAVSSTASEVDRLLRSLVDQSRLPCEIIVLSAVGDAGFEIDYCVRAWQQQTSVKVRIDAVDAEKGVAGSLAAIARNINAEWIMWCPADSWIRHDSVELLDNAMLGGAFLAYGDSDVVHWNEMGQEVHCRPEFRTCFDYDLLLQQDYLQVPVGFRRDVLLMRELDSGDDAYLPMVLAFWLEESGEGRAIKHVPRILSHRALDHKSTSDILEQRRRLVERYIVRSGDSASVDLRTDLLGASVEGSLRVRRVLKEGTRVTIIVPTRDRRDLLEPCLTSIFRSLPHNRALIEIIIINHQSSEPETLQYLSDLSERDDVRIIEYNGPFNWALMNNLASESSNADVLIFLNNDSAVLSDESWDELAVNALRPEVGAVGARLLYEDGTIQHAGTILDGWTSFSRHEGMGRPANDAGYLGRHALVRNVSTLTGACLATRAALFREVGGFDSINLPVEGNDTDYCLRLASLGYAILYNPDATLYHFESKSRGYNLDDRARSLADAASRTLRLRWPERVGYDPFYNPHFDPLSPPCARLRHPPATPVNSSCP